MQKAVVVFAVACLATMVGRSMADDWPQWRGPNRDGQAPGFQAPQTWPKQLQRRWSIEVGEGHASPVIAGDRVFVLSREGEDEVVRAIGLGDGKTIWSAKYSAPFTMSPYAKSHGMGPKSTPAVADGRLYTLGIGGILSCWDVADGKRLWQRDFARTYTKSSSLWYGQANSPVVEGDLLIAEVGGCEEGAVVALDRRSGEIRWKWEGDGAAYASPMVLSTGGLRHIIGQSQVHEIDLSAADGSLLWKMPFRSEYYENIVTPVIAGELVIFGGHKRPTSAYRLEQTGSTLSPVRAWENRECILYMSTPVVAGDRLLALANVKKGTFFCLDVATGKTLWTSDGRMGDYAALVVAGSVVLAQNDRGELLVIDPRAEEFKVLARYMVSEQPTWSHPALVGKSLLVKDQTSLVLWTIGE